MHSPLEQTLVKSESETEKQLIQVAWVQISERRKNAVHLPYAIGLLEAYVRHHAPDPTRYRFKIPICYRQTMQQARQHLQGAQVVGFSAYIWNIKRSLTIAQAHKQTHPDALIVFGGPQIPQRAAQAEAFLRQNPFVDVLVSGEGEAVFLALLEAYPGRDWQHIPGIAWIDSQGFHQNPQAPRTQDLSLIPSPFLSGVFEPLMQAHPDFEWIAVWETNRGCPFSCSFCDWGGLLQSKVYRFELDRILAEAEWFGQHKICSVFSADANFGILPRDVEIAQKMVEVKQQTGYPKLFQTQIAKNVRLRNFEIHKVLSDHQLDPIVSLSLQSLSPAVLTAIQRQNISIDVYRELQAYCQANDMYCYTDIIIGLPEETYDSFADGVSEVIQMGQHVRILFHSATILPNAEMGDPEYQRRYGLEISEMPFPGQNSLDDIQEIMPIVVAANSFDRNDWIRMNIFAWMTHFLYYTHRLLQPLFLVLHQQTGMSFREFAEPFCQASELKHYPTLMGIYTVLFDFANAHAWNKPILGDSPLLFSPDEGDVFTPDSMLQKGLTKLNRWPLFFREAFHLLMRKLYLRYPQMDHQLFQAACKVSQAHFYHQYFGLNKSQRLPGMQIQNQILPLNYNVWEFYEGCLKAQQVELRSQPAQIEFALPVGFSLV